MSKRLLCLSFIVFIMLICSEVLAGATDNTINDIYNRIVEEFTYNNYAEVIRIYEEGMRNVSPIRQRDSIQYYYYSKSVIAVFSNNDLKEASIILASLPKEFNDTEQFRHYVQGRICEKEKDYTQAREEFLLANGIFDSIEYLINLPTPEPTPEPTPTPPPTRTPTAIPTATPASIVQNDIAVVNNPNAEDRLNLRASASSYATSLGKYYNGVQVTILSHVSNEWTYVSIGSGPGSAQGYMYKQFLAFGTAAYSVRSAIQTLHVATSMPYVSLRSERSNSSSSLAQLTNGTAVELLGFGEVWHHVRINQMLGFIEAQYLTGLSISSNRPQTSLVGFPMPAAQYVMFQGGVHNVYTGPGTNYYRNGKASLSTTEPAWVIAEDGSWLLIEYAVNSGGYRRGYIPSSALSDVSVPNLPKAYISATVINPTSLYDDIRGSRGAIDTLSSGEHVQILASENAGNISWAYVELAYNGTMARGYIRLGDLDYY
ncbi:hypothetical protein AGMMS49992_18130 [Clostridia bacterium]|nr:hypothetical protein AGMMS49992_18130 [Clostridia bacterium]